MNSSLERFWNTLLLQVLWDDSAASSIFNLIKLKSLLHEMSRLRISLKNNLKSVGYST